MMISTWGYRVWVGVLIFDDLYLGFQTQPGVFFVFLALIIPAMIPLLEIFIILVEEAIVWAIASV